LRQPDKKKVLLPVYVPIHFFPLNNVC
jgi:hypothetical protein